MIKHLTTLCILLLIVIKTNAQTFYVSVKGNDQNAGTKEKPFASLEKAKEAVKKIGNHSNPVTVFIREGVYYLYTG